MFVKLTHHIHSLEILIFRFVVMIFSVHVLIVFPTETSSSLQPAPFTQYGKDMTGEDIRENGFLFCCDASLEQSACPAGSLQSR